MLYPFPVESSLGPASAMQRQNNMAGPRFEPGLLKPRSGSKVPGCSKNNSRADYPTVRFDKGFKNNYFKRLLIIRLFNEEL